MPPPQVVELTKPLPIPPAALLQDCPGLPESNISIEEWEQVSGEEQLAIMRDFVGNDWGRAYGECANLHLAFVAWWSGVSQSWDE